MADRMFVEANARALDRLQTCINRLGDADLTRPIGHGWTVSATLAHLTFWERRALVLLERWTHEGVGGSGADVAAVNDALLPQWLALPPRIVTAQLLKTAQAVDAALASAADELLEAIARTPETIAINRWEHRDEHLDEIERV